MTVNYSVWINYRDEKDRPMCRLWKRYTSRRAAFRDAKWIVDHSTPTPKERRTSVNIVRGRRRPETIAHYPINQEPQPCHP